MNVVNSIAFESPQFAVLSESQIKDIHLACLEVLRRTGIRFHHQEALNLFKEAGASISDGNLVKIPAHLVEDAIASTPSRIVMCDRDGDPSIIMMDVVILNSRITTSRESRVACSADLIVGNL